VNLNYHRDMTNRSYTSPRRDKAAAETRRAILDAALVQFEQNGYVATSMTEVAASASVSLNTIYSSVGKKPQLLMALINDASGYEGIADTLAAVAREESPEQVVSITAAGTRDVFERFTWALGVLYDNAANDEEFTSAVVQSEARYRARLRDAAVRIGELGRLREGLTVERAADVLWFYFGFQPWRELRKLGWSWAEAEAWLVEQATAAVVAGRPASV